MASQTALKNTNGEASASRRSMASASRRSMASSVGGLAADITTLVELQTRLFTLDVKKSARRLMLAVLLGLIGGALALASFPVVLFGLAYGMAAIWTGLPLAAAFWISAGVGLIVAALLFLFAWMKLRGGLEAFHRSQDELKHNIRWLKSVLKQEPDTAGR